MEQYRFDHLRHHMGNGLAYQNETAYRLALLGRSIAGRLTGRFSFEDRIALACTTDVPMDFLKWGCAIPHTFGITLYADRIGQGCLFLQNSTISANPSEILYTWERTGLQPKIGNLVRVYPNATISGNIRIGDRVIIAAGAYVSHDVPGGSIVYGANKVRPLSTHHEEILEKQALYNRTVYRLIPGLVYMNKQVFVEES